VDCKPIVASKSEYISPFLTGLPEQGADRYHDIIPGTKMHNCEKMAQNF